MSTQTPEKAVVLTAPIDINDVIKNAENAIESIEHVKTEMDKLKIDETQSQLIDLSVDNQKANTDNHNLNTKIECAKETIYATPLRKLDRPKSKAKSQHSVNHETKKPNNNDDKNGTTEDRHILNFLKDTSILQKKLQRSGCGSGNNSSGDSDYGKANFSSLAQEQHFVNLVQQNVIGYSENVTHETDSTTNDDESAANKDETPFGICADLKLVPANGAKVNLPKISDVFIKREWIIKLIALCLEQRLSKQSTKLSAVALGDEAAGESHKKSGSSRMQQKSAAQYTGVFLLGSNGSGKTSICKRIINGNTGTQGMLNRRLLCCYFINTQNAECHSLSTFIRCIVMQILSHSTLLSSKDDAEKANLSKNSNDTSTDTSTAALDITLMDTTSLAQPNKETKAETKEAKSSNDTEKMDEKSAKTQIIRQNSETNKSGSKNSNRDSTYDTYPPSQKTNETKPAEQNQCYTPTKTRINRGSSKIPVKIGNKSSSPSISATKDTPNTSPAKKITENKLISQATEKNDLNNDSTDVIQYENIELHKKSDEPKTDEKSEEKPVEKGEAEIENDHPEPPPKTKSVRKFTFFSILVLFFFLKVSHICFAIR